MTFSPLTPEDVRRMFPNATKSVLAANAGTQPLPLIAALDAKREQAAGKIKRRKKMNKTEGAYARLLEAKKLRGEIDRYEFEGIAFRWGGDAEHPPMLFSPDFCVFAGGKLTLVEVKNAFVRDHAIARFKGCRSDWPELKWELWQLKKGEWNQLH